MTRRSALLIGNAHFDDPQSFATLNTPANDVADMAAVLVEFGQFSVETLVDAGSALILEKIEGFYKDAQRGDLTLLYYSGHGYKDQDGSLYLAAKNTSANRMLATGVSESFIQQVLQRHARVRHRLIILDCCFSGTLIDGRRSGDNEPLILDRLTGEATAILTSSSRFQPSYEVKGERNAIFTQFLIEGIRTGAADEDGDGRITFDDLFNYSQPRVRARRPEQIPNRLIQGDVINLTIVELPKTIDARLREWHSWLARTFESGQPSVPLDRLDLIDEMRETPEFSPTSAGLRIILYSIFAAGRPALPWLDREPEGAVQPLVQIEKDVNVGSAVRCKAAAALGYLGHEKTLTDLIDAAEADRRQKRSARSTYPLEALAHYLHYAPLRPRLPWRLRGPCETWQARVRWRSHHDYLNQIDQAGDRLSLGVGLTAGIGWAVGGLMTSDFSFLSVGLAFAMLILFFGLGYYGVRFWIRILSRSQIPLLPKPLVLRLIIGALAGAAGLVLLLGITANGYGIAAGALLGVFFGLTQTNTRPRSPLWINTISAAAALVTAAVSLMAIRYFSPLSRPPDCEVPLILPLRILDTCVPDELLPGFVLITIFAGVFIGLTAHIAGHTGIKETNPIL